MESKELRIGNLVYPNSENHTPYPVHGFYENMVHFGLLNNSMPSVKSNQSLCSVADCLPIPLTEDWIVRAGFELYDYQPADEFDEDDENHVYVMYRMFRNEFKTSWLSVISEPNGKFGVTFNRESGSIIGEEFLICEIMYVHQLQNLLFSINGVEVEFKQVV